MASPFNIFRKRQRAILVVVGVLCIFVFTVGEIILSWYAPDQGGAFGEEVVVTWEGGELTESDLAAMRAAHQLTVRYLDQVVAETVKREGTPKGDGVTTNRAGQIVDPGISRDASDLRLVRTLLLAEQAKELGMRIPDDAIIDFLAQLSDRTLSSEELANLLRGATGGRLTRDQLFDHLRMELLARNYLRLAGSGDVMTPEDAWDYYNRLTQRVNASLVEFEAQNFLDQTPQPDDEEVREFYEKYKDQFPVPGSPEPGFKQRAKFQFAYFKADYDKFMEQAKAEISEEEVRQHFEENKENYKVPELPEVKPDPAAPPKTEESPEETPGAEPTEPKAEEPANAGETAKPESTPDEPAVKEEEVSPKTEIDPEAPSEEAPSDEKSEPAKQPGEAPAVREESDDVGRRGEPKSAAEQLVAVFQDEEQDAPVELAPPAEAEDNNEAPEKATDAEPTEPNAATDQSPADDAGEPTAEPTAKPADEPAKQAEDEAQPKAAVQYQPLEAVEDDIRRTLAMPAVRERIQEALAEANRAVEAYGRRYRSFLAQQARGLEVRPPEPPDFEAIAERLGLTFDQTPVVDVTTVGETELGQTAAFSFEGGNFQQIPFAQIAMQNEQAPLYQTNQISAGQDEFLYWPTEVRESRTPPLEEIRDEVVRAWRLERAFELAMQAARETAEKVRKAPDDKPLAEIVNAKQGEVLNPPAFSWMTTGAVPFGGGQPSVSDVPGVENPGHEFFQEVYSLEPGEVGVAPNQSKTAAYVIRVEGETPPVEDRREAFWQTGLQFNVNLQYVAQMEQQRKILDWLDELEKEWGLEWKRAPDARAAL